MQALKLAEQLEEIDPFALVDLLGIAREEAGLIATANVRLPAGWVATWKSRRGALELTPEEVAFIVGRQLKTIYKWCAKARAPRLQSRKVGPRNLRISPAALVAFLKAVSGNAPPVIETPAQRARRFAADRTKALAMCGESKPRSKRKSNAA